MRNTDAATTAALASGALVPRDFIWVGARNRATDARVWFGLWSDLGTISADVIDPDTGLTVSRTYEGAGDLVSVGALPLSTGFGVQTVPIQLSKVSATVATMVRTHDVRRAPIQMHRAFLDPASMIQVADAECYFTGEIDEAPITTPAEGQEGAVTFTATSLAQELTRVNTATRSAADQARRAATDTFFDHAATVGTWQIFWGQKRA